MGFTTRPAAKTAVEVLTFQHKVNSFVDVDSIQPILKKVKNCSNNTFSDTDTSRQTIRQLHISLFQNIV